jgi:sulfonate transport system ATP-binding protein
MTDTVSVPLPAETVPATRKDAAIIARDVRRQFDGRVVLDGFDLRVRRGEFVALLGRSGSGKSTFLRALANLDPDIEGDIRVPAARSVVFQEPRLLPWKRVLPNVTVGLPRGSATQERGIAALAEVGLAGHEHDWPRTLSGGEAQRASLARALVREPELLLLDEPFGALDALTRIRMHVLLRRLYEAHRPAVLFVTHDVDEAILLSERLLVLTDGRISFDEQVDARARQRDTTAFSALRSRLLTELGVDSQSASSPAGR